MLTKKLMDLKFDGNLAGLGHQPQPVPVLSGAATGVAGSCDRDRVMARRLRRERRVSRHDKYRGGGWLVKVW